MGRSPVAESSAEGVIVTWFFANVSRRSRSQWPTENTEGILPPRRARGSSPMLPSPSCRPIGTPSMKFRRAGFISFRFPQLGAQPMTQDFDDSAHGLDVIRHELIQRFAFELEKQ